MKLPDDHHHHHHLLPALSFLLIITSFTLIRIPESFCQNQQYLDCGQDYQCGGSRFTYPFWGGNRPDKCGYPGFEVTCPNNVPTITVSPIQYRVLSSPDTTARTLHVARADLYTTNCLTDAQDTAINFTIFSYSNAQNLTLAYHCPSTVTATLPTTVSGFPCNMNTATTSNFFILSSALQTNSSLANLLSSCTRDITVPIDQDSILNLGSGVGGLRSALVNGFTLNYEASNSNCQRCTDSNGRCGYNTDSHSFICYCSDRAYDLVCNGTAAPTQNVVVEHLCSIA